ncbi:hypothetical protein [Chryseobacterium shigense]|uniref:Uncharacterized protein n=1 Tax=Chryseobacterium shigense TaxID=297244 RepID=A0A841NA56_9FLAO|nr:hypothetical protein [Chryseobacterium shigense]MBB6370508.1 hypothetical protein [Chryseobacterium shigense]
MVQWSVQSIAASGLFTGTQILSYYFFWPVREGSSGGLPSSRPVQNSRKSLITKYKLMKNNRTAFETRFWAGGRKRSGLKLMKAYFQFNDLAASKEQLSSIMNCAINRNTWIKEDPSVIFQFHQSMRSFVRAGYLIALTEKKRSINTQLENVSPLLLGLLSEKEYQNPLLVFKKAFKEYSIREFDYFMSGIVYFSLGVYENVPEKNIINPYIHLIKMLDAAYIILERREKEINVVS